MKYTRIYAVIKKIPRGRVATYGQVARLAGIPRNARQVGYALGILSNDSIPWHRVVNAQGGISPRGYPYAVEKQRTLLEREKVRFNASGRVSLSQFQWKR